MSTYTLPPEFTSGTYGITEDGTCLVHFIARGEGCVVGSADDIKYEYLYYRWNHYYPATADSFDWTRLKLITADQAKAVENLWVEEE